MKRALSLVFALAMTLIVSSAPAFENTRLNTDITTELQNEQQITVSPLNDSLVMAVWRDFRLGYRRVGIGVSYDQGQTWQDSLFDQLTFERQSDPVLSVDAEGRFYALILDYISTSDSSSLVVYRSDSLGLTWSAPYVVIKSGPSNFVDKEWFAIDRTGGAYHGNIYVTWTDFGTGPGLPIKVTKSSDLGETWTTPVTINNPGDNQWSVPVVGDNGLVFVAWVSGYPHSITATRSTNGGASWEAEQDIFSTDFFSDYIGSVDYKVYPYPAMDADITGGPNHGNLYMAFCDRRSSGDLDIYFSRSISNGITWSTPVRINDDPIGNGAEQFHPWLCVNPDGAIFVVFMDQRVPPVAEEHMNCFITASYDGGLTFSPNQRLSTETSDIRDYKKLVDGPSDQGRGDRPDEDSRAGVFGEYIGVTASTAAAHAVWVDTRNGHQDSYSATVGLGFGTRDLIYPPENVVFESDPIHFLWSPILDEASQTPIGRLELTSDPSFTVVDELTVSDLASNYHVFIEGPLSPDRYYWRVIDSLPDGTTYGHANIASFVIAGCPDMNPAFTSDIQIAEPLRTVQFTNLSDTFTTCIWYFGDGDSSTVAHPAHSYANNGLYTVSLVDVFVCQGDTLIDSVSVPDFITVTCCMLRGDIDHDGEGPVITDLVYLVNFMFSGGPQPPCLGETDVDGNGAGPDIADLVYLVNYMFNGGPSPVPCS